MEVFSSTGGFLLYNCFMSIRKNQKVAVALSGGVDSGVAAYLLKQQGYDLVGFHLHLWGKQGQNRCCSPEIEMAARKTAEMLGIPYFVLNYEAEFKRAVVAPFLEDYAAGLTPNPCVNCNKNIKFGKLFKFIKEFGCDYLATGHYARILARSKKLEARSKIPCFTLQASSKDYKLLEALDKAKDQSYFLYMLSQDQLAHLILPLGEMKKEEVWKIARVQNLPVKESKESMEICFIEEDDYRDFLKKEIPEKLIRGDIVDQEGHIVGRHEGLPLYTIGQRKGLEIKPLPGSGGFAAPMFVVGKDIAKNQLIVGGWHDCLSAEFAVSELNRSNESNRTNKSNLKCEVRIRLRGEKVPCEVAPLSRKKAKVTLKESLRGVSPGQSAVFYEGEEVLGGGIINLE